MKHPVSFKITLAGFLFGFLAAFSSVYGAFLNYFLGIFALPRLGGTDVVCCKWCFI